MTTHDDAIDPHTTDPHTTNAHSVGAPTSSDAPPPSAPTGLSLRRSSSKRMIAGVAGGLSDRFDIDVVIIRAVFVVLTFLYGLGLALYLVMWAVVPRDSDAKAIVPLASVETGADGPHRRRGLLSLAAAVALGLLVSVILFNAGPHWGRGIGALWLIFLVVLAVVALLRPTRGFTLGRLLAGIFFSLVAIAVVAAGIFLGVVAMTGVPMSGGVGQRVYAPTSLREVQRTYRLAFGSLNIDLRQVPFGHHTVSVTASVAVGSLNIEVPPGVVVDLSAQSGIPHIHYPQGYSNFYVAPTGKTAAHLVVSARVGIGQLNLSRGLPGSPLF